jgi:hypothetical protein
MSQVESSDVFVAGANLDALLAAAREAQDKLRASGYVIDELEVDASKGCLEGGWWGFWRESLTTALARLVALEAAVGALKAQLETALKETK